MQAGRSRSLTHRRLHFLHNPDEPRQRPPMPWMRDTLACMDIRGVGFAHPNCRTDSELRDSSEGWLHLFDAHIAS
jgi:hypothetical protein